MERDFGISSMMIIYLGLAFATHCGGHHAARLAPLKPDTIVAPATHGIPLAIELTRALRLDHYLILQKSQNAIWRTRSLNPSPPSPHPAPNSSSSTVPRLRRLRRAGAEIVAIAAIVTQVHA